MSQAGNTDFSNEFGTVYPDRVAFNAKKGWFGGGSLEELPMRHLTSIRIETTRHAIWGALLLLIGLGLLSSGDGSLSVFGLALLALGVLSILGWPKVTINTAGGDLRTSSGGPWQRKSANEFAAAVRQQLFQETK